MRNKKYIEKLNQSESFNRTKAKLLALREELYNEASKDADEELKEYLSEEYNKTDDELTLLADDIIDRLLDSFGS